MSASGELVLVGGGEALARPRVAVGASNSNPTVSITQKAAYENGRRVGARDVPELRILAMARREAFLDARRGTVQHVGWTPPSGRLEAAQRPKYIPSGPEKTSSTIDGFCILV